MIDNNGYESADTRYEVWQVLIGAAWVVLIAVGMIVSLYFLFKAVV